MKRVLAAAVLVATVLTSACTTGPYLNDGRYKEQYDKNPQR